MTTNPTAPQDGGEKLDATIELVARAIARGCNLDPDAISPKALRRGHSIPEWLFFVPAANHALDVLHSSATPDLAAVRNEALECALKPFAEFADWLTTRGDRWQDPAEEFQIGDFAYTFSVAWVQAASRALSERLAATKAADERVRVLTEALREIRDQQEHEIALDPDWPRRIASAALAEAGGRHG